MISFMAPPCFLFLVGVNWKKIQLKKLNRSGMKKQKAMRLSKLQKMIKFAYVRSSPAKASPKEIFKIGWQRLLIAAYFPHSFRSNQYQVGSVKSYLSIQWLPKIENVRKWVKDSFVLKPQSFHRRVIRKLPHFVFNKT